MGEQHAVGGPFRGHSLRTIKSVEGRVPGPCAGRSQDLAALSSMGHVPKVNAAVSGGVRCGAEEGRWRVLAGGGVGGEGAGGEAAGAEGAQVSPPPPAAPETPRGGWPGYMSAAA